MKNLPFDWRRVALIAGGIFLIVLVVDFNARLEALTRLNRQAELVRTEATQAAQTKVALETSLSYADTDQIVEQQARGEGHMIQEGDYPFIVFGQEGSPPIATPEPTPIPTPEPNWRLWWELFFGE